MFSGGEQRFVRLPPGQDQRSMFVPQALSVLVFSLMALL